jgi:hypothetical protein
VTSFKGREVERYNESMTHTFHLCLSPDTIEAEPELLRVVKDAGVTDVWTTGFLYGYWYYSLPRIQNALRAIQAAGLAAHAANVPLGHPGDSLGARSGDVPLSPPPHWRMGVNADGSQHSGTSLHPPAVKENCQALRELQGLGVDRVFVDDDFRLAVAPGGIGGCFCAEHRQRFLEEYELGPADWKQLLEDVTQRAYTPLLCQWVEFTCDELTAAFRRQQAAAPGIDLGIMVMYFGAEKAGIRLEDYREALFRVGEFMFSDETFNPLKGKTDELFSVLFHRRFCSPERSFSESTAFPADQLSARNLAAKMAISLIADVRNTMFMSGLSPFPREHWATLSGAIQRQRRLGPLTAGCQPRGPFKHVWGLPSRYTGDDDPFSLFLALGVPFEVVEEPQAGWNFLSKADARVPAETVPGVIRVTRPGDCPPLAGGLAVAETLPALFELKHQLIPQLQDVPYILEDLPAVCAWYPEAKRVLVWNLSETPQALTLRLNDWVQPIRLDGLGVGAVDLA